MAEVVIWPTLPLDTMQFEDEDPENRLFWSTVMADHKDPKVKVIVESEKLDFSFTNLQDVESLKTKEPWAGKRKPIIEE